MVVVVAARAVSSVIGSVTVTGPERLAPVRWMSMTGLTCCRPGASAEGTVLAVVVKVAAPVSEVAGADTATPFPSRAVPPVAAIVAVPPLGFDGVSSGEPDGGKVVGLAAVVEEDCACVLVSDRDTTVPMTTTAATTRIDTPMMVRRWLTT